jgi:hypothetical protein
MQKNPQLPPRQPRTSAIADECKSEVRVHAEDCQPFRAALTDASGRNFTTCSSTLLTLRRARYSGRSPSAAPAMAHRSIRPAGAHRRTSCGLKRRQLCIGAVHWRRSTPQTSGSAAERVKAKPGSNCYTAIVEGGGPEGELGLETRPITCCRICMMGAVALCRTAARGCPKGRIRAFGRAPRTGIFHGGCLGLDHESEVPRDFILLCPW